MPEKLLFLLSCCHNLICLIFYFSSSNPYNTSYSSPPQCLLLFLGFYVNSSDVFKLRMGLLARLECCELTHRNWWMRCVLGCWERRVALICHWRGGPERSGSEGVWGMVCGRRRPSGVEKSDDQGKHKHTDRLRVTMPPFLHACDYTMYTVQIQAGLMTASIFSLYGMFFMLCATHIIRN